MQQFAWFDAWILLATLYARTGEGDLKDVIAAADYINHAIPTRDELELAFSRLSEAGYVEIGERGYLATGTAERIWNQTAAREKTVWGALDQIARAIGAGKWAPGPMATADSELLVAPGVYERAVAEYLEGNKR